MRTNRARVIDKKKDLKKKYKKGVRSTRWGEKEPRQKGGGGGGNKRVRQRHDAGRKAYENPDKDT